MSVVRIDEFSVDGLAISWSHDSCGNSDENIYVSQLEHPSVIVDGVTEYDKTIIIVKCQTDDATPLGCGTMSFYPMAGGPTAQKLHYNHLMQHSLDDVKADATDRGIAIQTNDITPVDKTKDQLVKEIIQDQCATDGVPFLL